MFCLFYLYGWYCPRYCIKEFTSRPRCEIWKGAENDCRTSHHPLQAMKPRLCACSYTAGLHTQTLAYISMAGLSILMNVFFLNTMNCIWLISLIHYRPNIKYWLLSSLLSTYCQLLNFLSKWVNIFYWTPGYESRNY